MGAEPIVSARGLTKSFGPVAVLKGVDFDIMPSKVSVVIGPSGSGKSTLLRCCNGLETADGGTIRICGQTLVADGRMLPEAALNAYWAKLQDESFTGFLDMLMLDLPKPVKTPPPVLVLGAERDSIFGPDAVNATARRFGVNAEWLPGIAHDAMLDTGWRSAADAILAWLNRTLPPDPTPQ